VVEPVDRRADGGATASLVGGSIAPDLWFEVVRGIVTAGHRGAPGGGAGGRRRCALDRPFPLNCSRLTICNQKEKYRVCKNAIVPLEFVLTLETLIYTNYLYLTLETNISCFIMKNVLT
jgi:hypothetical protein